MIVKTDILNLTIKWLSVSLLFLPFMMCGQNNLESYFSVPEKSIFTAGQRMAGRTINWQFTMKEEKKLTIKSIVVYDNELLFEPVALQKGKEYKIKIVKRIREEKTDQGFESKESWTIMIMSDGDTIELVPQVKEQQPFSENIQLVVKAGCKKYTKVNLQKEKLIEEINAP